MIRFTIRPGIWYLCHMPFPSHPSESEHFRIDTGRAGEGTFVRVVHVYTGKTRGPVILNGQSHRLVVRRLTDELIEELKAEGKGFEPSSP